MQEYNVTVAHSNVTCNNDSCTTLTPAPLEPTQLKWGLLALIVVIFCTALGNLLVCLAVCWDRRLQNMTNYFLMSLAIADFLVSIIVMPFGMVVEIYGYFPLQSEFCAFWVTMDVLMCTASIWHMCTMSMDRYFTLKYPMQYGRNKTKTMVAIKIFFVWAVSIAISSPICIYGLVDETTVYNDHVCVIALKEFAIYGSVFAFYIPLFIMILTYLLTIRILCRNQKMMQTIVRSDFRMRPRGKFNFSKSCQVTTLVSPPSSSSRRESHNYTELSSLARTPNREKVNMPDGDNCDTKLLELKEQIDNAYVESLCANIPNGVKGITDTNVLSTAQHLENEIATEQVDDKGPEIQIDSIKSPEHEGKNGHRRFPDTEQLDHLQAMGLTMTTVHVQSPSEDDTDDLSSLIQSNEDCRLIKSNSNSPKLSRFRMRTNTDVSMSNFPTAHSSLKIPKVAEKQCLQASVSCSNFSDKKEKDSYNSLTNCGGLINRDYKSLEWCQHFYQIQEEMDQCLREIRREKINAKKQFTSSSQVHSDLEKVVDHLRESERVQMDELKPQCSIDIDSGDSLDDIDSSSENASSDLLTVKLYPKSVYMYKLDVPSKSSSINSSNGFKDHSTNRLSNGNYLRAGSMDSDKSLDSDKPKLLKRSSIRKFFQDCKKRNGLKHLISSKTTSNEKKASKVLGIIFGVFVVLWTPFFTANILMAVCDSCAQFITPVTMSAFVWMGYIASLANPIIYTMFNTAFRRAFIRILHCQICRTDQRVIHRSSMPSYAASVYTDRRQTVTVLLNGAHNHAHDRLHSEFASNGNGSHRHSADFR